MTAAASLTTEQQGLRDAVRTLVTKRSGPAAVRAAFATPAGYDTELWAVLCDQIGVPALGIDERHGGIGASAVETAIVMAELGRRLTPSPLLGSVLAASLVAAGGDEQAAQRLLPPLATGERTVAVAWAGPDGRWDPETAAVRAVPAPATPGGGNPDAPFALEGTAAFVIDGEQAETLLVAAQDADGISLFEVDAHADGVRRAATPTMDLTRRLATVEFAAAPGRRLAAGSAPAALATARDAAWVALAAEQAGAAAQLLADTVAYSKVRVQFGRPIGSFQALKHRMADLHVLVESSESAALAAAAGIVDPVVARVHCSDAFRTVAGEAIQLLGGIAITWEHDAHLYFKRAHGSAVLLGPADDQRERVARLAGL